MRRREFIGALGAVAVPGLLPRRKRVAPIALVVCINPPAMRHTMSVFLPSYGDKGSSTAKTLLS